MFKSAEKNRIEQEIADLQRQVSALESAIPSKKAAHTEKYNNMIKAIKEEERPFVEKSIELNKRKEDIQQKLNFRE